MRKISALDIRIAVLAVPLVAKEEGTLPAFPRAAIWSDDRLISLFQNSPKPLQLARSTMPPVIRKARFALMRLVAVLKAVFHTPERADVLSEIAPPRALLTPTLPHPPFRTGRPPRYFRQRGEAPRVEGYAPACLMPDDNEDLPAAAPQANFVRARAKGTLKQTEEGFAYVEVADAMHGQLRDPEAHSLQEHHIPVILPHEWAQKKGWGSLPLNETFHFEIVELRALRPQCWPGVKKVYFLRVACPELEGVRSRLMLPLRLRGHDFHIGIAYCKQSEPQGQKPLFRLNVSCHAA